jgi:hypothetical protein
MMRNRPSNARNHFGRWAGTYRKLTRARRKYRGLIRMQKIQASSDMRCDLENPCGDAAAPSASTAMLNELSAAIG